MVSIKSHIHTSSRPLQQHPIVTYIVVEKFKPKTKSIKSTMQMTEIKNKKPIAKYKKKTNKNRSKSELGFPPEELQGRIKYCAILTKLLERFYFLKRLITQNEPNHSNRLLQTDSNCCSYFSKVSGRQIC